MDTITITFPEVKVKIMLFEILQNIARKVFEKAITDIDSYLRNKRERGKLKNTGCKYQMKSTPYFSRKVHHFF